MLALLVISSNALYLFLVSKSCCVHWCTRNRLGNELKRKLCGRSCVGEAVTEATAPGGPADATDVSVELTNTSGPVNPVYEHGASKGDDQGYAEGGEDRIVSAAASAESQGRSSTRRRFLRYDTEDGDAYYVAEAGDHEAVWDLPEDGVLVNIDG